eukprot:Blabericola_migrator_1__5463@NODE_2792_length_2346_cov_833_905222_g1751_i0_p1_GENE_NODE_2792_length_2346_cov_833_905222_g1751_i0NODE_2792_length_2346_cov_833_905222_g1751_i0_p1_ORF_typecomplete_len286_score66_551433/PF00244_20/1e77AAA_assoc_2/PF16193_5/6_6e02AAA_assoc_2/PF16193_5/0_83BAR_3/PF16746_5/0_1BAR_3/PF16746_5/5_6e03_NODE_2792_length_2346_cov_833_905222_g1751_i013452202
MSGREPAPKSDILTEDSQPHEKFLFKCRMAENAERYDDMVQFIKEVCKATNEALGANERNFLSVAYKNSIGSRRSSLRYLGNMKTRYETKGAPVNVKIVQEYLQQVLSELETICHEVLDLIQNTIMRPEVMDGLKDDRATREFKVFFLKMKADYYRYLAEFAEGDKKKEAIANAADNYVKATEAACNGPEDVALPPPHPIRLGLSLNHSVFLYEIQEKPEEAKKLAKQAFDDALDKLDSTGEMEYKDSTLILQLLRDNTTLWSTQDQEGPGEVAADKEGPTEKKE